jgi:hypothetical protein
MRKLSYVLAASLFAIGLAGQAHAVQLGFVGDIAIQVATLDPVQLPGSGTVTINGSSSGGHISSLGLPASAFKITGFVLPVTDPAAAPIKGLQVTAANAAATFDNSGGPLGGQMAIQGANKVCLFGPCSAAVANISVPLSVAGVGGSAVVTAAVNLTVIGAPWTTGTVSIGTITAMGGAAPASETGAASGTVSLVTPVFVSTNIGPSAVVPVFAFLNMHFVPEPGTLVLLGAGIAGLVSYGRTRNRKA